MLFESLSFDLQANKGWRSWGRHRGAALRLGYYYPSQSESALLKVLAEKEAEINKSESEDDLPYESIVVVQAISGSRSPRVKREVLRLLQQTDSVELFLALCETHGESYNSQIYRRAKQFIDECPKENFHLVSDVLSMIGRRFPAKALGVFKGIASSTSFHQRDALIDALWHSRWSSKALATFLDDKRSLGDASGYRICDRAAQAISNFEKSVSFKDGSIQYRDQQIQVIKRFCREAR